MEASGHLTNEQLIADLIVLRERIAELERSEADKTKYLDELNRTKGMFEGLFEFAPDAIMLVGLAGNVLRSNKHAERLFGYTRTQLLGMNVEVLLPERFRARHLEHRKAYMESPRLRPMGSELELYALKEDGTEFPVNIALGPFQLDKDAVVIAVIRDISSYKASQELIKRQTSELIEAMKQLEAFSYSVSHDLRAPLRHLSSYADQLRKRLIDQPDEKVHRYMLAIANATKRMERLIDDLLAFSRLGLSKPEKRKVNLNILVTEVLKEMADDIKTCEIEWRFDELPVVDGDRALLKLVLNNLISNAVKYTRRCSNPEISVRCRDTGKEIICSVSDNGIGFDMQFKERIFDVFQRLHTEEEFEGTGIGLANVRRIIARHGGKTWAEGAVDHGATFFFSLPKREET